MTRVIRRAEATRVLRVESGVLRVVSPGVSTPRVIVAPGAQGGAGPPGSAVGEVVTAAEPLGGNRVVTASGFHADSLEARFVLGITTAAIAQGAQGAVRRSGVMVELSWSWTPGAPLFIGPAGILTETPPSDGPVRRLAVALTATSILIDFQPIIIQ